MPLRQSASLDRAAPPPPTPQRSGGVSRGNRRIHGGPWGKSQSPWPSLAAGGCHKAAAAAKSGARTPPRWPQRNKRTQSCTPTLCHCVRAPRKNAPHRRLHPPAERRRYKGVRRESKEGVGGTRNPPIPPWPPEAATRLLPQPKAVQERRHESRKATAERSAPQNSMQQRQSAAPARCAPPLRHFLPAPAGREDGPGGVVYMRAICYNKLI